jgi:hypothetical protein
MVHSPCTLLGIFALVRRYMLRIRLAVGYSFLAVCLLSGSILAQDTQVVRLGA